jgi:predicted transcriptional regulator
MGRNLGYETNVNFKLTPEHKDELRRLAHRREMNISELVRSAVEEFLLAPDRHVTVRLSTDDYTQLKALARSQRQSPSALLADAVAILIEDMDEPAPQVERVNPFIAKAQRAA